MPLVKKVIVTISILFISLNYISLAASQDSTQDSCEILFIGSSYFGYNNLVGLFENLSGSSGRDVYIGQQITSGYLSDHADRSITESIINEKNWDYVILQGVGSITAYPEIYNDHPVYPALEKLHNKIFKNCESTKMVFCLPWAFEDGMTWLEGWTDTYEDMQIKIYENTLRYSDDIGFVIAPVGWAWNKVLEDKNYPLHYLHRSDWNHPSLNGSYLMACVIFSTIFQESSINLNYYGGLPEDEAIYFQTVASNTVLDNLNLWNITKRIIKMTESSIPYNFYLYQNYPNPFNASTQIEYEISKKSLVEIIVYDILGKTNKILVNENKMPGTYSVRFDGSGCPSGIYYYRIKTGNQYLTKKMLIIE